MKALAFVLAAGLLWGQESQAPARIVMFEATPMTVKAGESVELRWWATGADRVWLEPLDQEFPPMGHVTYVPRERTVFWIHATNGQGGQSVPLVLVVLPGAPPAPAIVNEGTRGSVAKARPGPGGIWIQFAALADEGNAEDLGKEVSRLIGRKVARFEIDHPGLPGHTLHRLRTGPFSSIREARTRLRIMLPKLRSLQVKPIVAVD